LIETLQRSPHFTPHQIKQLVENVHITAAELMPWADFDHPVTDSYGRKLVYDGGHFEIMVMSWMPGDFSAIHDHGATQWGAVQCFGAAEHYIYRFANGLLTTEKSAHYTPGMVRVVDHNLIHQMGNSGNEPFLSLHVYGCTQPTPSITGNARIFDLLEGSIQYTDGGVFFCLPEDQINQRVYDIRGDRESTLRHHQQMGDRLCRILSNQDAPELERILRVIHWSDHQYPK
jgi:predicted metal-dependent enzyme (double-stranded beta helix superfamily)